jgi:hypothetical protein
MRLENQGLSLWYSTPGAPGPEAIVPAGAEVLITVGLSPADASNKVEVHYRTNNEPAESVPAHWFRNDQTQDVQYFRAALPAFRPQDEVQFWVTASCAGRYVPAREDGAKAALGFRVGTPPVDGVASPTAALQVLSSEPPSMTVRGSPPSEDRDGHAHDLVPDDVEAPSGEPTPRSAIGAADPADARPSTFIRNGGGGGLPPPMLRVWVDGPLAVSGQQPGVQVTLTGGLQYRGYEQVDSVRVKVDDRWFDARIGQPEEDLGDPEIPVPSYSATWAADVRFYRAGPIVVQAELRASPDSKTSAPKTVTATLASTVPDVAILVPQAGHIQPVSESGSWIALQARTSDQFGPGRTIRWESEGRDGLTQADPTQSGIFNGQV